MHHTLAGYEIVGDRAGCQAPFVKTLGKTVPCGGSHPEGSPTSRPRIDDLLIRTYGLCLSEMFQIVLKDSPTSRLRIVNLLIRTYGRCLSEMFQIVLKGSPTPRLRIVGPVILIYRCCLNEMLQVALNLKTVVVRGGGLLQ
jgi:hypothetical protein